MFSFYYFHVVSTDSACPTHSHQLLFSGQSDPSFRQTVGGQSKIFTKLDMVYSDCLWSPPDMVSRKYGRHQIYLNNPLVNLYILCLCPPPICHLQLPLPACHVLGPLVQLTGGLCLETLQLEEWHWMFCGCFGRKVIKWFGLETSGRNPSY